MSEDDELRSANKTSQQFLASLSDELFEEHLRALKQRIKGDSSSGTPDGIRLARHAESVVRALKAKRKNALRNLAVTAGFNYKKAEPKTSRLLDSFFPDRKKSGWKTGNRKSARLTIDRFCLIDHPAETLRALAQIAKAESRNFDIQINFEMRECTDVAAFLVFGLMRRDMHPVFRGGMITKAVRKVLQAVQLDNFLKIRLNPSQDTTDLWPFEVRTKSTKQEIANPQLSPQQKEKVAVDFVQNVQNWLKAATELDGEFEQLNDDAVSELYGLITEILDNAERHGSTDDEYVGGWSIAGFMARRPIENSNESDYVCHVAIVSEGTTIADGLENPVHDDSRKAIDAYLGVQRLMAKNHGPPELLRTIMALQPGVTRLQTQGARGGTGFPRTIQWLQDLGGGFTDREPQMTVISGNCCVMLRPPYNKMARAPGGKAENEYIFFNRSNEFGAAPDPNFAFTLEQSFPGAIIAMRFRLRPRRARTRHENH